MNLVHYINILLIFIILILICPILKKKCNKSISNLIESFSTSTNQSNTGKNDWKQLGKDAWSEFGDVSDTWSLSWKISEPIINKAFESYGKLDNRLYEAAMEAK